MILSNDSIIPAESELGQLQLDPVGDSAGQYMPDIRLNYYKDILNVRQAELKLEKSKLFPEIFAGYFNQEIDHVTGFWGWQAGLTVPIWFLPQQASIKNAKLETIKARNEVEYQQQFMERVIQNLIETLERSSSQINYYRSYALNQAELIIKTAEIQYRKEDIDYLEYLQALSSAMQVKRDFLDVLDQYNQSAIQLEYFLPLP